MSLGGPELLIVLAVVLLLFGAKKVPDLARSLGQAKREFEDGGKEPARPVVVEELPPPVVIEPVPPVGDRRADPV
jgi:sec-independent protein translocase protein TatA